MTPTPIQTVFGRRAMVVADHPYAAAAGLRQLEAGGNATDAVLAAATVMAVVLPQYCSIGGDAFALIYDRRTGTIGLNGSGPCAAGHLLAKYAGRIPDRGPLAATVPGVVKAWGMLHQRFGSRPWAELFRETLSYADDGFPVAPTLSRAMEAMRA